MRSLPANDEASFAPQPLEHGRPRHDLEKPAAFAPAVQQISTSSLGTAKGDEAEFSGIQPSRIAFSFSHAVANGSAQWPLLELHLTSLRTSIVRH
jgi:hypothetical protein